MVSLPRLLKQPIAACVLVSLAMPLGAATSQAALPPEPQATSHASDPAVNAGSVSAPGVPAAPAPSTSGPSVPQTGGSAPSTSTPAIASPSTAGPASPFTGSAEAPQQPLGTAAAPDVAPQGVPGSRPSGASIAPAKQKRVHSVAIRVGLLVGAGVAVGTVAALSLSSSSRPH